MFNVGQSVDCCFFVQTQLVDFNQPEFSVVRQHEEFVWLHDRYEEGEEYAGIVVSNRIEIELTCKANVEFST